MGDPFEPEASADARKSPRALGRDVVVIGASAGGIEALCQIVEALPEDLPAAVFVALHVPPTATSALPLILQRRGLLRVAHAVDGEPIEHGRVYIAPPDRHLLVEDSRVRLSRGPRENGNRPAVDPLFRTAARAYGPRVVGVILSGNLYDGTIGLKTVEQHGGVTVVQDPDDALYPSMPRHAIMDGEPHHIVPASRIAALVTEVVEQPVNGGGEMTEDELPIGEAVNMSCPECGGPLQEVSAGRIPRFVCRVGHAFSTESLYSEQADAIEGALWTAIRALEERGDLAGRLADRLDARGAELAAKRFRASAEDARGQADTIRSLVTHFDAASDAGPDEVEIASAAKR